MKVAVIIIGRVDFISEENLNLNKQLLEGCDIFIHSDKKYKLPAYKLNPAGVIFTDNNKFDCLYRTYEQIYHNELIDQKKLEGIKHYDSNFNRIFQWIRLEESLEQFDLEKYDIILKWRTDLPSVYNNPTPQLIEFQKKYGNFLNFFKTTYNPSFMYMFKDLIFASSYNTMMKCSFYHRIKDFIAKKEEEHIIDINLLKECDLDCAKFEWLDSSKKTFEYLFTSETAMIINNLQNKVIMKSFFK